MTLREKSMGTEILYHPFVYNNKNVTGMRVLLYTVVMIRATPSVPLYCSDFP